MTSVYLMMFLLQKSSLDDLCHNETLCNENDHGKSLSKKSLSLFLVDSIADEFKRHCEAAKKNLLIASLKTPIYGPLSAIHQLISHSVNE